MNVLSLFEDFKTEEKENNWKKEWVDMPEFIQDKKEPFSKIIIRCESEEDLMELSKILNQKLTKKTKSIWFPYKSHFRDVKMEWSDES